MAKNEDVPKLQVKIFSPRETYYDGDADVLSGVNDTGSFDVLPLHHNFMTLLKTGEGSVAPGEKRQSYKIEKGLLHVKDNVATVFLDV